MFKSPSYNQLIEFYGNCLAKDFESKNIIAFVPPYQLKYNGNPVKTIRIHKKISEPVQQILESVLNHYGKLEISNLKLDMYSGAYCAPRLMRNGTKLSVHSYGAALDFCAELNTLTMKKDKALFAKPEYDFWNKTWKDFGAFSLGVEKNYDFMHYQFCLP